MVDALGRECVALITRTEGGIASAADLKTGAAGSAWVSSARPLSRRPSVVKPLNLYSPSGKRARSSSSVWTSKDGSALSKKNSVMPCMPMPFWAAMANSSPLGPRISITSQPSPSMKTWIPASPSVSLISKKISASSSFLAQAAGTADAASRHTMAVTVSHWLFVLISFLH